ncbi:hypothetical protein RIF29_32664 [Crotalaria pallida]|uniref:Gamma-glutamylcyclotransferase family protein n=1 Tax=Crotalaria pallida TaxID=3830 RepID=A0AAN9EJ13_CROPI
MVAEADLHLHGDNHNHNNHSHGHNDEDSSSRALIFTYGTLKRGFSNHPLLQDLIRTGDASFVGTYRTALTYPLVTGPYRVPFLLNIPGSGHHVRGELYSVSTRGLDRMDELEGTTRAHYERLPIKLIPVATIDDDDDDGKEEENDGGGGDVASRGITCAEAYYAHGNYAGELWKKNEKRGLVCYGEKEARGYVKRKDRPQHLTFLDHIRSFISSPSH